MATKTGRTKVETSEAWRRHSGTWVKFRVRNTDDYIGMLDEILALAVPELSRGLARQIALAIYRGESMGVIGDVSWRRWSN